MGALEKDVMLRIAYFTSDQADHFEVPTVRSCTSKGTVVVLNPIQEERALKKGARSGIISNASMARRSKSLKSEAFAMSMRVALLISP